MEEQFPPEEGYHIARYVEFKFKDDSEALTAVVPSSHSQCTIAKEPLNAEVIKNLIMTMH